MTKFNYAESVKEENEKIIKGLSDKAKSGLITLGVFGIGCGIYGFKIGQKLSYKRGFRAGELYANDQFRYLAKEMIETIRRSRGE